MFCYTSDDPTGAIFEVRVQDWKADLDLKAGSAAACDWFNIPASGNGNGVDPDAEDDQDADGKESSVTVVNLACPEGVGELDGFAEYAETCAEPAAGVSFKLDGESTGNPGDYPTDADGMVSWDGREADHYYLTEFVPEGYGAPVAFCDVYRPLDEQRPDYQGYAVSAEARIEFDLEDSESILCLWFNVPVSDEGDADSRDSDEGDDVDEGNDGNEDGASTKPKNRCDGKHASAQNGVRCGGRSDSDAAKFPTFVGTTSGFGTRTLLPATGPIPAPADRATRWAA